MKKDIDERTLRITVVDRETKAERVIKGELDQSILQAAHAAGVEIMATCGERGRCRSCRVKVLKGELPPPTLQDRVQLGHEEVEEHFRLSCQTKLVTDCTIIPVPPKAESGYQILAGAPAVDSDRVALDSGVEKHFVTAKIPTEEHHQTSDIEAIIEALPREVSSRVSLEVLRRVPMRLRAEKGKVTVTLFGDEIIDVEVGDTRSACYGMAFDIGTTSIVGNLLDLNTAEQLAAVGSVNPQTIYGGDLMSRIAYAQFDEKKLATLRAKALTAINNFINEACKQAEVSAHHIYKVVVVGNTCMHHIFLGIDTSYVGLAPYAASVRVPMVLEARQLPLKAAPNAMVCTLPIVAGFVGADTMGAVLATRIFESEGYRALVDIGTNGEVVIGKRGKLMACSAPAGPALEGGQIRHGMRGAMGAIERVSVDEDVHCHVIGNAPAIGICGSGLIDAAAKLLDAGVLEGSGLIRRKNLESLPKALQARIKRGEAGVEVVLAWAQDTGKAEDVTLTQKDIRQLQLAKGAIYSGIMMLQKVMDIPDEDIEELMLCGGFGNYINTQSAVSIRLLPAMPLEKISYVGNAAHLGAQMALLSETERHLATRLAREIEHVALAARPDFQDVFVDAINLSAPATSALSKTAARAAGAD